MNELDAVLADLGASTGADLADVAEFVAIESVSGDPHGIPAVREAADWLAAYARGIGLDATIHETSGRPIVTATTIGAERGSRTILVYAHYDVQPVEPLDAWASPPFEATERDGRLYGRGTSDDKGQLLIHLSAVRSFLRVTGRLPINLTFLFEGEEEQASPHLDAFVAANVDLLRADAAIVTDGSMFAEGVPSVGYGVRGIVYLDVQVRALDHDLHSGIFGGAVPNAARILGAILATLHDRDGRVLVPGFYDQVTEMDDAERDRLAALPFDETEFGDRAGVRSLTGEAGFSTLERLWVRPTIDVNGFQSGFTGDGMKTIIPAVATARVSARLVPDEYPSEVAGLVEAHLRAVAPRSVNLTVTTRNLAPPAKVSLEHPAVAAAARALEAAYGRTAVYQRHGGTIPAVSVLSRRLDRPTLMLGFGLPDANTHGPNEWLSISSFRCGREAVARLWAELGNDSS